MLIKLVASVVNGILTISKLVYSHATEGVIKQVPNNVNNPLLYILKLTFI